MKNFIPFILCLIIASCHNNSDNVSGENIETHLTDTESEINAEVEKVNLSIEQFSEIDSTGVLLFPLVLGNNKASSYSLKSRKYDYGYWNIIFYNGHTASSHLLTEEKIYIQVYSLYKNPPSTTSVSQAIDAIFYQAVITDYNKDGNLNGSDATYLFVSDKRGKNFRQLSPDNYDLRNWKYVKSLNKIILSAVEDSNSNDKFDEEDTVKTFEVTLDPTDTPKEIFGTKFTQKMKVLFAKDWKIKED